jgi:3-hydroxyanthranilate 3,4-dioxygenase
MFFQEADSITTNIHKHQQRRRKMSKSNQLSFILSPPTHIPTWHAQYKQEFLPPIANKLLYKGQNLSVMFVGGPNSRKDFHCEEGSEIFYQLEGKLELITIQQSQRVAVELGPGDVYCLLSRIQHSPQRLTSGFGLVIERTRQPGEYDRMSWYSNFDTCDRLEWEQYFICTDLGKDLKPIAERYHKEKAEAMSKNVQLYPPSNQPCPQPHIPVSSSIIPFPQKMNDIISLALKQHVDVPVFGYNHPDKEFDVMMEGSKQSYWNPIDKNNGVEIFIYQLKGKSKINSSVELLEQYCIVVSGLIPITIEREQHLNSITLVIRVHDMNGNKQVNNTLTKNSKL